MEASQLKFVNTIFLAFSLFVVIGCQNQADKAELDKFRASAQIQEQNKDAKARQVDHFRPFMS